MMQATKSPVAGRGRFPAERARPRKPSRQRVSVLRTRGISGWADLALLALHAGVLDDRPPLLGFGFLIGSQRFGRLLVARRDHLTELSELMLDLRVGECFHNSEIEPGLDLARRSPGDPEAVPDVDVETGQTGLVDRRDIGRGR